MCVYVHREKGYVRTWKYVSVKCVYVIKEPRRWPLQRAVVGSQLWHVCAIMNLAPGSLYHMLNDCTPPKQGLAMVTAVNCVLM